MLYDSVPISVASFKFKTLNKTVVGYLIKVRIRMQIKAGPTTVPKPPGSTLNVNDTQIRLNRAA